jgi:hypothetical protein
MNSRVRLLKGALGQQEGERDVVREDPSSCGSGCAAEEDPLIAATAVSAICRGDIRSRLPQVSRCSCDGMGEATGRFPPLGTR